jgi:hypothetical protein
MFDGPLFRPGSWIEESQLWPTPHSPVYPLLLEWASTTGLQANGKPARGHNRSQDVHVLWRYDRPARQFCEIIRILSEGPEWYESIAPIVARWIVRPPIDHVAEARTATGRLAALMDGVLAELTDEGREIALSFFYDQVVARMAEGISEQSQALRKSLFGRKTKTACEQLRRKPPGRAVDPASGRQAYTDGSVEHLISVYDRAHPKSLASVRIADGQTEREPLAPLAENHFAAGVGQLQRKPPERATELKPDRAGSQTA